MNHPHSSYLEQQQRKILSKSTIAPKSPKTATFVRKLINKSENSPKFLQPLISKEQKKGLDLIKAISKFPLNYRTVDFYVTAVRMLEKIQDIEKMSPHKSALTDNLQSGVDSIGTCKQSELSRDLHD